MAIANPFDGAGDFLFVKDFFSEFGEALEIGIGMGGVVMRHEPFGWMGALDESGGIAGGGVAPVGFVEIFFGEILRLMDEEMASFHKVDEALVGLVGVWGDFGEGAVVVLQDLIVGDVADGLMGRFDFKAVGEPRVLRGVEIKGEISQMNGRFLMGGAKVELRLHFI